MCPAEGSVSKVAQKCRIEVKSAVGTEQGEPGRKKPGGCGEVELEGNQNVLQREGQIMGRGEKCEDQSGH